MRPASSTNARSARRAACAVSWVTSTQVSPWSRTIFWMSDSTSSLEVSSSAEVGSSSSRASGELARVRATETRWASPPERLAMLRPA
jgi:hypothetical protein